MVTVTAIEHEDVRGKKLKYLKITNGKINLLVNVGDKTYEGVKAMEAAKEELKKEEAAKKVGGMLSTPLKEGGKK